MVRRQRTKSHSKPRPVDRNESKLKRWNKLAEIELDEEDQFHASRDKILLDDGDDEAEDGDEEEVFALRGVESDSDSDDDPYDDPLESDGMHVDPEPATSKSKSKSSKSAKKSSTKDASDSEEEETWGHSKSAYYASNAAQIDSEDDEANELEEQEALRLQAKACEGMCDQDFGLGDVIEGDIEASEATEQEESPMPLPTKPPRDKQFVLRALEIDSPETLALARDWDDTAHNLVDTKARIDALDTSECDTLELSLQHMYYQALLTYASTLAFYLHLRATDKYAARPALLRRHPILARLLALKEGIHTLESLGVGQDADADADSDSDSDLDLDLDEEEEDLSSPEDDDLWSLIKSQGLTSSQLASLLNDATPHPKPATAKVNPPKPVKPKAKLTARFDLVEPTYRASRATPVDAHTDDPYGELTALAYPDVSDKQARKKSLRFHVSRIASSSARRTNARVNAMGGDDDIPYRERKKEREVRLDKERENKRANGQLGMGGDDLDDVDPVMSRENKRHKRKRGDEDAEEDAIGYYDLVKQVSETKKARKKAEYEAATARPELEPENISGPRSVTRAILKNKGLTPRRPKAVRNPRVKKRQKYEQAKKKVASQKAVFKGGIGDVSKYSGEQSGISKVVKSVRL